MNTLMKRSVIHLIMLIIIAAGCFVFFQLTGHFPSPLLLIPAMSVPVLLGNVLVDQKHGPELDERDREIQHKANLVSLAISWTAIVLGITALGRVNELVLGEHLTYTLPLGFFVLLLSRGSVVFHLYRRDLKV